MLHSAVVVGPLALATILAIAAIGKLREPDSQTDALAALQVPKALQRRWIARAHPWIEILLAAGLLLSWGWLGVLVATLAAILMGIYLVLVARVVRQDAAVDCDCFGAWGTTSVTRKTVVRNSWYVALAGIGVWAQLMGSGPRDILVRLDADAWWWLLAAAAAAMTVGVTMWGAGGSPLPASDPAEGDLGDYVRTRIPAVPVTLGDGSVQTLRQLSAERAQLLIFVSEGCRSCVETIAEVPTWRERMPQLDIRLAMTYSPDVSEITSTESPMTIHDSDRLVWESLGIAGTPSAVLLGADGFLAGGPVLGGVAVPEFVDDVCAELNSSVAG